MKHQAFDVDGTRGEYKNEKHDCTVFAISIAAQMPYGAAHRELELAGRKARKGFPTRQFISFKQNRIANYRVSEVPLFAIRPTLARVRHLTQSGRYIVTITRHAFAVIDGIVHDSYPSGGRARVKAIYK